MRRSEFIEEPPASIDDLVEFCEDNSLSAAEDLVPGSDLDNMICSDIRSAINNEYWYNIRDYLNDIPEGCDWYRRNGTFDYEGYDDGWTNLYEAIVDEMDANDLWDEEDDDDDEYDDVYEDEDDEEDGCENDGGAENTEDSDGVSSGVFPVDSLFEPGLISVIRAEAEECDRKRREETEERRRRFSEQVRESLARSAIIEATEEKERREEFYSTFG